MKATTSNNKTNNTHKLATSLNGHEDTGALQEAKTQSRTATRGQKRGKAESELRAAARRHGYTLKELAHLMGVNYSHLCSVANGRRSWTPDLREKVAAALGEALGQEVVYRQGGLEQAKSSHIRERAREVGLSMGELADRVGVSRSYLSRASRGKQSLGPKIQALVEAELQLTVKVEAAKCPTVDPQVLWERMEAHGYSQNQVARLAGISNGHLSQVMNGNRAPSGGLLRRLHGVLFRPTEAELVVPAEVKILAWKKDGRNGMVIRGAGGPGGDTIRTGGRVPWGAQVEYAYRAGYDSRGRVSVTHLVDERGYGAMLNKPGPEGA